MLIESGGVERANTLLVAACDAYASRPRPLAAESEQFEALARRLFPTAAPSARARAATILASAPGLTPALEILVFENLGDGLVNRIRQADAISENVLLRLVAKGDTAISAAVAERPDLTGPVLARLFPINSRKVYRALAANRAVEPRGSYLTALTRSAQMDREVASILSMREDFDAALLTPVFFDLPEAGRLAVLRAYSGRELPSVPLMRTFEQISVATDEFTAALMKLFSDNRRPRITKLLTQITGLDEIRCGEIAHDTSGAALFVVLRAFGCTAQDGLKVLIHATSHDEDRSRTLAAYAHLFEAVDTAAMVFLLSAWRGDVKVSGLARPEHTRFVEESRRTPTPEVAPRTGTVGQKAIEQLDRMRSRHAG
ncbi:DUF2336 domain-containing protein [Pelagibacterium montanilacus]|uniref:DUF2336 domain-containing protein n=1 Tax=Pelagibacterium montanilacus TaxID=2185280 RepID=UPI0013E01188|nr:DUF2336 domain-containing protein [Pelagibacterium montanilacus]